MERGCRSIMIRTRNKFHTIQSIAGVLIAVFMIINLNSLSGLKEINQDMPDMTVEFTSKLANVGDRVQKITEDGFLQSVLSKATGKEGGLFESSATARATSVSSPANSETGGIGVWIDGVGQWFASTWTKGTDAITSLRGVKVEENPVVVEVVGASGSFSEIHQPYISNVPNKGKYIENESIESESVESNQDGYI